MGGIERKKLMHNLSLFICKYSRQRLRISKMNQIFTGNSFTPFLFGRLFTGINYSRNHILTYEDSLEVIAAKLRKKKLRSRFIQSGRENDSPGCFEKAIALGSFSARAELALLCFNQNLPYAECKKAFDLVKDGHRFGCSDCSGMLAHIYITGFRGVVCPFKEDPYPLACASASAGSLFGKLALAYFMDLILDRWFDPYEEKLDVLWTDPFIQSFEHIRLYVPADDVSAEDVLVDDVPTDDVPAEEDPFNDWSESDFDRNILDTSDIRKIGRLLIEEIKQDHTLNPNNSKVWVNLPSF